jgi:membrane protease YdiL (CAAX protease family)
MTEPPVGPLPEHPPGPGQGPTHDPGPAPYGPPHYPVPGYGQPPYPQGGQPPQAYPPQVEWAPVHPAPGSPGNGQPPAPYQPVTQQRPSYPHPEPREYHEMYRTWNYHWWRPVVGIVAVLVGMVIVLPILAIPVLVVGVLVQSGTDGFLEALGDAAAFETVTPAGLLYLNVTLGLLILWTWGVVRVLHQMRPRWLSSVVPKLRWKFLLVCFGISVVALFAQLVVGMLVPQDANPDVAASVNELTGTTLALGLVILLTTPFQAIGEEYLFRGYLLQATGSLVRNRWVAIVLTALLFATAHLQFDPPLFFDRFMFGLVAAWLVIRTGGLEAGIALHVLNNYLAFGLALLFGNMDQTLDIPDVSWWNVPVTLTQSLVYAALVAWAAKAMKVQRRTHVPAPSTTDRSGASVVQEPAQQPLL